jgi:hypothetical protein
MTADEAIKKACDHFYKMNLKNPSGEIVYSLAILFMVEEIIRIISSRSSSPSEGE